MSCSFVGGCVWMVSRLTLFGKSSFEAIFFVLYDSGGREALSGKGMSREWALLVLRDEL